MEEHCCNSDELRSINSDTVVRMCPFSEEPQGIAQMWMEVMHGEMGYSFIHRFSGEGNLILWDYHVPLNESDISLHRIEANGETTEEDLGVDHV